MRRGYSKTLTVILIIIIIAVIGLLAFLGYNAYTNYRIKKDSQDAVDAFAQEVTIDAPEGDGTISSGDGTSNDNNNNNIDTAGDVLTNPTEESGTTQNSEAKRKKYKGFYMLGTIEIPKTNVKYPVLEKVTKKSLETSVAVIYPFENPVLNAKRNVVIVGHNYRNGVFFSNNKKLSKGDKIYITDLDGKRVTYTIYNIFQTTETDTSFYNRDTNGKREITLSTCTDDASARLIIEARE